MCFSVTGCGNSTNPFDCMLALSADQLIDAMINERNMVDAWLNGQKTDLPDTNTLPGRTMIVVDGEYRLIKRLAQLNYP